MLRIHIMQLVYNLSDPEMEDYLYEVESMRRFAHLRLCESIPDETTILNFRHYLEVHKVGKRIFETINQHLADKGLRLREGPLVDATIMQHLHLSKMQIMHVTRKCIKPKRVMNGITA